MKNLRKVALVVLVLAVSLLLAQTVLASSGSGWDLSWYVSGSGGHPQPISGSGFSVMSTIGQTAVGSSSGSGFQINHGYWQELMSMHKTNLPLITKG